MDYLLELNKLKVFKIEDVTNLTGNINNSKYVIKSLLSKNYIRRIKRNYYVTNELSTLLPNVNKYELPIIMNKDTFISHHSVFDYFGLNNQIYNSIDVSITTTKCISYRDNFNFLDDTYIYHKSKSDIEVNVINGVRITSIERAIVDIINDSYNFDFYELIECIDELSYLDTNRIKKYLDVLNIKLLYKKVGYVLSYFKEKFKINDEFFQYLKSKGENSNGSYIPGVIKGCTYNKEWNLYVLDFDSKYLANV